MASTTSTAPGSTYVASYKAAQKQAANPLAQTSPGQIGQTINRISGMYGTPMSDTQIQSTAQGQIDPIIAAITKSINDRTSQATQAIGAGATQVADALGRVDYGAPYTAAKGEQAAVDAALQQSLSGGGTALAGDLNARLGQINDPSVGAAASGLASRGAAIGNTELAHGSASLSNLIAQAAAAREYGVKQPGIARQQGLQDIAGLQQQAVGQIGDKTAQVMSQLPGIVQSLRGENQHVTDSRAQAAQQLWETLTGQNITKATASAGLQNNQAQAQAKAAPRPDAALTRASGYVIDQYGNPILDASGNPHVLPGYTVDKTGNVIKTPPPAKPAKPQFSPVQLQKWQGRALKIADFAANGHVDPANPKNNSNPVDYNAALTAMQEEGIPTPVAQAALAHFYQPGGTFKNGQPNGRPFTGGPVTSAQKKTIDTALSSPVGRLTGH